MPYKYKRDCPVCNKPGLRYMSNHLRQVHALYGDERKKWLRRAGFSTSFKYNTSLLPVRPTHILKQTRCVGKKTSSVIKPAKTVPNLRTPLTTTPYLEFYFRHKFSLLVVGPHKVEKLILSNRFWNTTVSCTKNKRVLAFFGATINGKNVTKT